MVNAEQREFIDFIANNFDNHCLSRVGEAGLWMDSCYDLNQTLRDTEGFKTIQSFVMSYVARGDWYGIAVHWAALIAQVDKLSRENKALKIVNPVIEKAMVGV